MAGSRLRWVAENMLGFFSHVPESSFKNMIRRSLLLFRSGVPAPLIVNLGDTVIQVGTPNISTVERYSRLVGNDGHVIIVEADEMNQNNLEQVCKSGILKNVTLIKKGAWSSPGVQVFCKSDEHAGDHKIKVDNVVMDNDFRNDYSEIRIEVDTLDNMLEKLNLRTFDFISVTVNGAELEVLKGARNLILNSKACRIYAKGHARYGDGKTGDPINKSIREYLESLGCNALISGHEDSISGISEWRRREGDVYAWK